MVKRGPAPRRDRAGIGARPLDRSPTLATLLPRLAEARQRARWAGCRRRSTCRGDAVGEVRARASPPRWADNTPDVPVECRLPGTSGVAGDGTPSQAIGRTYDLRGRRHGSGLRQHWVSRPSRPTFRSGHVSCTARSSPSCTASIPPPPVTYESALRQRASGRPRALGRGPGAACAGSPDPTRRSSASSTRPASGACSRPAPCSPMRTGRRTASSASSWNGPGRRSSRRPSCRSEPRFEQAPVGVARVRAAQVGIAFAKRDAPPASSAGQIPEQFEALFATLIRKRTATLYIARSATGALAFGAAEGAARDVRRGGLGEVSADAHRSRLPGRLRHPDLPGPSKVSQRASSRRLAGEAEKPLSVQVSRSRKCARRPSSSRTARPALRLDLSTRISTMSA